MDAILRYLLYKIAFSILFIEILLIILCIIAIIIIKLYTQWSTNRRKENQNQITQIIEIALFKHNSPEEIIIPSHLQDFRNLIEVLEEFDYRFSDQRWVEIKRNIIKKYLLEKAEKYTWSHFWYKQQLASRCFLLYPEFAKEKDLSKLLHSSRYLVRIPAAACITRTNYKNLLYQMIEQMSKEPKLSQFPYRDALIQMDQEKFHWIESLISKEKNPAIVAICLDILSTRYSNNLFKLARSFINHPDRDCRLKAIELLGNVPSNESIDFLVQHLDDTDYEIREASILGLEKLYAINTAQKIGQLLNDRVWAVRHQAAKTLKNFGKDGIQILLNQNKEKAPKAYEIAQYVLALPF